MISIQAVLGVVGEVSTQYIMIRYCGVVKQLIWNYYLYFKWLKRYASVLQNKDILSVCDIEI